MRGSPPFPLRAILNNSKLYIAEQNARQAGNLYISPGAV